MKKLLKEHLRGVFAGILTLGIWLISNAPIYAEQRLFLLFSDSLYALDASDSKILDSLQFPDGNDNFDIFKATPGGKYIFILNAQTGLGMAVDFEDLKRNTPLDLSRSAPLASIVFSPMGDTLYALAEGTGNLFTYKHKAGVLEYKDQRSIENTRFSVAYGSIATNSRGTRIYSSNADGLNYYLASDLSLIKTIPDIKEAYDWMMAPGGRMLWGAGENGWFVVDESRGGVKSEIKVQGTSLPVFDMKGRTAWILAEEGKLLVALNARRAKELRRIQLQQKMIGLGVGQAEKIWLVATDGIYGLEGVKKGSVERYGDLPGKGNGEIVDFISVKLKSGMGFACF